MTWIACVGSAGKQLGEKRTDGALSFVGCGYHVTGFFAAIKLDINEQDTVSSFNFKMSKPISKQ